MVNKMALGGMNNEPVYYGPVSTFVCDCIGQTMMYYDFRPMACCPVCFANFESSEKMLSGNKYKRIRRLRINEDTMKRHMKLSKRSMD